MKNSVADRNNAQPSCAGLFIMSHLGWDWSGLANNFNFSDKIFSEGPESGFMLTWLLQHTMVRELLDTEWLCCLCCLVPPALHHCSSPLLLLCPLTMDSWMMGENSKKFQRFNHLDQFQRGRWKNEENEVQVKIQSNEVGTCD